jgi:uncharacterized protein (DUF885 family)
MMFKQGLYPENKWKEIGIWKGIRFRAARAVVDAKLQTGEFTFEDAVVFMVNATGAGEEFIRKEVKRYIAYPTQAMSYLIGKIQIQKLKTDYMAKYGQNIPLKEFHDDLLRQGSIPVSLSRIKLLDITWDLD